MRNRDEIYYRYLCSSEVGQDTAKIHREIVAKYFWDIFNNHKCSHVLDIGCGLGFFIDKSNPEITAVGIDSNIKAVEHCCREGKKVIVGSAVELPVGNNKIDGILCAHLLEHLPEPEKAFMEFYRVLKSGGVLIVRVPPFDSSFYDDWSHIRPFTKKTLKRLAAVCGFNDVKVFYYHYDYPFVKWRNPFFKILNYIRHLPIIQSAINSIIKIFGLPPKELVLVAIKVTNN